MNALRIYQNEGSLPFTRRVDYANVETHIRANDQFAGEAELLSAFRDSEEVPHRMGDMILDSEGDDDHGHYFRYVVVA